MLSSASASVGVATCSLLTLWLCPVLQASDLQRQGDGAKALQDDMRAMHKANKQHEEARSKAEVSRVLTCMPHKPHLQLAKTPAERQSITFQHSV